ncbi:glycosyltransferase family 2 protein [Halomonas citrativorans]|uniref:Glycosyltransferase n=1 Tax=Halomonas citrativorans TaxID=2742612 RepID=A0ABR9FGH5_9GAMM|nr:glycosyltransferase family 2 protein [Halomonas citrativorans]MBE0405169.1 glycosyltransferase [Halomonas citrativorans]
MNDVKNKLNFFIFVVLASEADKEKLTMTLASLRLQPSLTCMIHCKVLVPGPMRLFTWVSLIQPSLKITCTEYHPERLGEGLNQALSNHAPALYDWIGVMQPGDCWSETAFGDARLFLSDKPNCRVLYVDEVQKKPEGDDLVYYHKPAWSPDWLWSMPYTQRGVLFRFDWLNGLQKFSLSQEITSLELLIQELLLRAETKASREMAFSVCRIPKVLFVTLASGNELIQSLPKKILLTLAQAYDSGASIQYNAEGRLSVSWSLPEKQPTVSLLIPTRDGLSILKPCVDAILCRTAYSNFEIIIIDNQSSCPETLAYLDAIQASDKRVRVLKWNRRFNYSAINNFAMLHAKGDIVGLVNNDIEPINGEWLTEMVRHVCRKEVGCVGAKLYYPNDTLQHAGVILGLGGVAGHGHKHLKREAPGYYQRLWHVQNYSAVTAACLLVRKDVYKEVGGLNETFLKITYNDVDFCLKVLQAGYRNVWTPNAELYHHESVSRGKNNTRRKKWRAKIEFTYMRMKWSNLLKNDPAYNPNLTLEREDFSLR